MRSRGPVIAAVLAIAASAGLVYALRKTDDTPAPAHSPGPAQPADIASAIAVTIDGAAAEPITSEALASRPALLQARGRKAWPIGEVLGRAYRDDKKLVTARTADGRDHVLRGNGKPGHDVILVRRDAGSLYIGWLVADAAQYGSSLGDAERPAERLEEVAEIAIIDQPPPDVLPPAQMAIERQGAVAETLTETSFATAATATIRRKGHPVPAIELEAVGSVISDGRPVAIEPPAAGARAMVFLNRRKRFNFAWADAAGAEIPGTKLREISRVVIR